MKKIDTNIITGFLGVGKTTAIIKLLETKPENEVWAVLVNEFGEVGVDGALLNGKAAYVKEIPGGCMCCVAGLPMQVGLNLLISQAKPDRLLIEPTGLGHPKQIIETLTNKHYRDLLSLKSVITLVDPRNLNNNRYLENDNFNDQLAVADVVVANKTDQCHELDQQRFKHHLEHYDPPKQASGWVSHGQIDPHWLDFDHQNTPIKPSHYHTTKPSEHKTKGALPAPAMTLEKDERFTRRENSGQGFFSCGWLFHGGAEFDYNKLYTLMTGLTADRLKAVIKTNNGVYTFNSVAGVLSMTPITDAADSRIEVINDTALPWDQIEASLLNSVID